MAKPDEAIKQLIRGLFEDKQVAKELDDSITKDSATVKTWMKEHKADSMLVDDISVTYKPQVRSSMDEAKVIEILKRQIEEAGDGETAERLAGCIKTREYVDDTELESVIYDELLSKDDLAPAVIEKVIYTLNLRRAKKKD